MNIQGFAATFSDSPVFVTASGERCWKRLGRTKCVVVIGSLRNSKALSKRKLHDTCGERQSLLLCEDMLKVL